jgi:hypothetical protein
MFTEIYPQRSVGLANKVFYKKNSVEKTGNSGVYRLNITDPRLLLVSFRSII